MISHWLDFGRGRLRREDDEIFSRFHGCSVFGVRVFGAWRVEGWGEVLGWEEWAVVVLG